MDFKNGVINIQTAGYNGARIVYQIIALHFAKNSPTDFGKVPEKIKRKTDCLIKTKYQWKDTENMIERPSFISIFCGDQQKQLAPIFVLWI